MLVSLLAYAGKKYPHTLPIREESQPSIKRFPQVCAGFNQEGKKMGTFSTFPATLAAAEPGSFSLLPLVTARIWAN